MLSSIPNPIKSFQIDLPLARIADGIRTITQFDSKYKFVKENDVLNQFTFSATEFLSIGVLIELTLKSEYENRTSVTIEVRRALGSFDKSHEVTLANKHISDLSDLLARSLSFTPEEYATKIRNEKDKLKLERSAKIEANKQKEQELKENNPLVYWTKQLLTILATLGLLFLTYKMITYAFHL